LFIPALISYFKGYLTITVTGKFCERFINVCTAKGILLWDIKKISANSIRCRISVPAFKKLPPIAFNTGVNVHINIKHGFPFFLSRYKNRKLALCGVFIFIISVIIANQFVWDIEITGNHNIPKEKILAVLNESGLKTGMLKSKINQRELKNDALLSIPELSWLWVDKRGSKIVVDIREKIETPEILNPDDYYNVIAAKDGIIQSMTVRGGVPVLGEGDTVLKDTVIVTGKIPSEVQQNTRYVRASAEIYARVWYEKKQVFSNISTTRKETGKSKSYYSLIFLGNEIRLFHKDNPPYEFFDKEEKNYSLYGFGLIKRKYNEIVLEGEELSEQTVADYGTAQLKRQIEEEVMPNSTLLDFNSSHIVLNDSTVEVTVKAEYLEDIAVSVKGEILESVTDLN